MKDKNLALKTRKARRMDILKFNADENMRCALEDKYNETPLPLKLVSPAERARKMRDVLKARGRQNDAIYAQCRFLHA